MSVGMVLLIFLITLAALAALGYWQKKRSGADDEPNGDKVWDNVVDLNDRFNRARYMDQDGK